MNKTKIDIDYIKKLEQRCELLEVQCDAQRKTIEYQADSLKYDINPSLSEEIETQIANMSNPILEYYPWGDTFEYPVLGSSHKLDDVENDRSIIGIQYKQKTDWHLIAETHSEINRACKYLSTQSAFFNNTQEKDGFHRQRVNAFVYAHILNYGLGSYVDNQFIRRVDPLVSTINNSSSNNRPKDYKINYTRQELCAIHFIMFYGEFENLC